MRPADMAPIKTKQVDIGDRIMREHPLAPRQTLFGQVKNLPGPLGLLPQAGWTVAAMNDIQEIACASASMSPSGHRPA